MVASISDVECLGEIHHRGFTFQSMQRAAWIVAHALPKLRMGLKAAGRAARSTFRVAPADMVEALLDGGEARFDHRFEFEVGEDIGQVLFDAFADEFTDIEGIYAPGDAFPDHIDLLADRARGRHGSQATFDALGVV